MKCKKCGAELSAAAEFCEFCGTFTGADPGTFLNGVQIDTKTYSDAEPYRSQPERIFSGRGERSTILNGKKTRLSERANTNRRANHANINGTGVGAQDIKHRILAGIGYFGWVGFLFAFFLGHKRDDFVRFHLNQALAVNLLSMVVNIINGILDIGGLVIGVLSILVFICIILGCISAFTGTMRGIPVIGKIKIIQ